MDDCEVCNKYKEHCYWKHQGLKGKQFYVVMNSDFFQQMKIPKKFSDHFKEELSGIVNLRNPSGNIWSVTLTKTANGMSLQTGWKEFVEVHHIQEGDILVFKYNGNSVFKVSVFSENHCERAASYICTNKHFLKQASPFPDSPEVSRKNRTKDRVNYQRDGVGCSRRTTKNDYRCAHPKNNLDQACTLDDINQASDDIHDLQMLTHPKIYWPFRRLTDAEGNKAWLLINAVRSRHPCFISVIYPSNVGSGRYFTIPSSFATELLPPRNVEVTLSVPDREKKWRVSYLVSKVSSGLCGNWITFAQENKLKEGDVCLFELVNRHGNITMKVHINRTRVVE